MSFGQVSAHEVPGLGPRWQDVDSLPTSSTQKSAMAIIFIFTALALIFYVGRMYVRFSKKAVGLDDWLMTVAMLLSLAFLGPTYMFFRYEYIGFPTSSLPDSYDLTPVLFWNWIMQALYNPILALVKSSILVFLLRLGSQRPSIKRCIYALNTFNICQMVATFLVVMFQTIPVNAYWDSSVEKQRQIDSPAFYVSTAIITIITDCLVLAIPVWIFAGLKMRLAEKVALITVFMVGFGVTVMGIIRLNELFRKFYNTDPNYDPLNSVGDTYSTIEVNLAIIAACAPPMRPIFRKMTGGLFSSRSGERSGGTYGQSAGTYGPGTGRRNVISSYALEDLHKNHTEVRGHSPNGSEDEIMTYNGIVRTVAVDVSYDKSTEPQGGSLFH